MNLEADVNSVAASNRANGTSDHESEIPAVAAVRLMSRTRAMQCIVAGSPGADSPQTSSVSTS